jgi:hypothetical protein
MRERRKGPIGRAAGLAEGFAATVRRMQREREPRVLVYDETGYARLVQPDGRGYERLLETAERMVALVDEAEVTPKEAAEEAAAERGSEPAAGDGEDRSPERAARSDARPRSGKRAPRRSASRSDEESP